MKPMFNGGFPIGSPWPELIADLMGDVDNASMRSVETACRLLDHPRAWKKDGTQSSFCYCKVKKWK
jgi:hypothetical protein